MGLSSLSVQSKTELLHFHPHNTNTVHKVYNKYHKERQVFKLVPAGVYDGQIDFTFILFSDEDWFHSSG
jgi:hypothetical protein